MIEYEYLSWENAPIRVWLDGKLVGEIRPVMDGWQYYPKGQKEGGKVFTTLLKCQQSLEEE